MLRTQNSQESVFGPLYDFQSIIEFTLLRQGDGQIETSLEDIPVFCPEHALPGGQIRAQFLLGFGILVLSEECVAQIVLAQRGFRVIRAESVLLGGKDRAKLLLGPGMFMP